MENISCLVASGPSLNETIHWLKTVNEKVDICAVGLALKMILVEGITPKAVVISDVQDNIVEQLQGIDYLGDLFYLSTINHNAVSTDECVRKILFQEDHTFSRKNAAEKRFPLLETGGSVAQVTFSLLDYQKIILFV